jgi:CcmD family protein
MTSSRIPAAAILLLTLLLSAAPASAHAQQPPAKPQDEFVPIDQLPPQDELPAAPLLISAYAFVWLAIGGYVLSVGRRLGSVQKEIERLEADLKRGPRT